MDVGFTMNMRAVLTSIAALLLLAVAAGCSSGQSGVADAPAGWGVPDTWVKPTEVQLDPAQFIEGVDNEYCPLIPGTEWVYEADTEDGTERIEVVVLDETRMVAGIECVVVRDTVSVDGELVEDTYDWYAQDLDGNVWYMGEDSKEYEKGEVASTAGSWEAGVNGALPGIKVWAEPRVGGAPYYQELYAGEAEDLGRDLKLDGQASVPLGDYTQLLVIEEWNKLSPDAVELKYYAAGIGVVMETTTRGGSETVELIEFSLP